MDRRGGFALVLVGLTCLAGPPSLAGVDAHLSLLYGYKSLDTKDWDPVDGHTEWGVLTSVTPEGWPFHFALDVRSASDEGDFLPPFSGTIHQEASSREVAFGLRKIWSSEDAQGYVGAGISSLTMKNAYDDALGHLEAEDDTHGTWVDAGVLWRFAHHFEFGLEARWSSATVDLDYGGGIVENGLKAGGVHAALLLGLGF